MYKRVEKPKVNKSRSAANSIDQIKSSGKQGFRFVDNRQKAKSQVALQLMMDDHCLQKNPAIIRNTMNGKAINNHGLTRLNSDIGTNDQPIQGQFSKRVGAFMVVVRDSALRHLDEQQMRAVIADDRFMAEINAQYTGAQVDRFTFHVGQVNLIVNIYPAGNYPPIVEVFHSDAGYRQENRQKAQERWNNLYGDKRGNGGGMGGGGIFSAS